MTAAHSRWRLTPQPSSKPIACSSYNTPSVHDGLTIGSTPYVSLNPRPDFTFSMQVGSCRSRRMQTVFQITAGEHSMRALSPLVSCGVAAQVETVTAVHSAGRPRADDRTAGRRVGKECVSTLRSRVVQDH